MTALESAAARLERGLDRAGGFVHAHGPLALLGVITGVCAWIYARVFLGEPAGNDASHTYAELARIAEAMRDGDWDWWNPNANSGYPSGYYYQVVPQAVTAALSAITGMSPLRAYQIGIYVPLLLIPAATYRAVRVAGGTPWQAIGGAIAVSFCVGESRWGTGADGMFWSGLYTQLWAFTAMPLALAHGYRWIEEGKRLPAALGWGIFVGLCHPFAGIALGVALATGAFWVVLRWAIWRAIPWPTRNPAGAVARLVVLGAGMVLGAACAWLPVLVDYEAFGGFPHRVSDEVGPGFDLLHDWITDGWVLDEKRMLPVLTALILPVFLAARARWLAWLWAAAIAYILLLGAGPNLPKVGDDDLLPMVRFYGALQIALSLAVGIGVAALVEQVWRLRLGDTLRPAARSAVTTIAALAGAVTIIGGADVLRGRARVATDWKEIERKEMGEVMAAMRDATPGRLQCCGQGGNHWAISLPYVEVGRPANVVMGGASLQSSTMYPHLWQLADRDFERAAWIFDAPLVLTAVDGELDLGTLLAKAGRYELRELPAPGLVGPVEITGVLPPGREASRAAVAKWLWSKAPYRNEASAYAGHGGPGAPPKGRTLAVRRHGSWIAADVVVTDDAAGPTTFVIRESWHPRWRATLDGAPVTIRRVTPDYLAIDVPAGAHTLALRFERPRWTWLLWLLWPAVVIAAQRATRDRTATLPRAKVVGDA